MPTDEQQAEDEMPESPSPRPRDARVPTDPGRAWILTSLAWLFCLGGVWPWVLGEVVWRYYRRSSSNPHPLLRFLMWMSDGPTAARVYILTTLSSAAALWIAIRLLRRRAGSKLALIPVAAISGMALVFDALSLAFSQIF